MTIEHSETPQPAPATSLPPRRGGWFGNRSFAVIACGLPTLIVILVAIAFWDTPLTTNVTHDHGSNLVHSHWHTHDVGISHDHSHPGVERIEHSHRHEHGHLHTATIQPQLGGNLIPVGHVHRGQTTLNYFAELRTDGAYLILNFWLESNGEITAVRPTEDELAGTLLEQYRPEGDLRFKRLGESYIARRTEEQCRLTNPAVVWRRIVLHGELYEFKIAIP